MENVCLDYLINRNKSKKKIKCLSRLILEMAALQQVDNEPENKIENNKNTISRQG